MYDYKKLEEKMLDLENDNKEKENELQVILTENAKLKKQVNELNTLISNN